MIALCLSAPQLSRICFQASLRAAAGGPFDQRPQAGYDVFHIQSANKRMLGHVIMIPTRTGLLNNKTIQTADLMREHARRSTPNFDYHRQSLRASAHSLSLTSPN